VRSLYLRLPRGRLLTSFKTIVTTAMVLGIVAARATTALASPNVPLDDPVYVELARLRALGRLPAYLGGFRPITEAQAQRLLREAHAPSDPFLLRLEHRGFWITPLRRVTARLELVRDTSEPYENAARRAEEFYMAGAVTTSCEYTEGRPCGQGVGSVFDLDSASGYGRYVSAFVRLRITVGSENYAPIGQWDRAYVNAEWGPLGLEVGRDVLVLGPGARAQMAWGTNAPPLDMVRISALRFKLPGISGHKLRLSFLYFIGRLRDPQHFDGTMIDGVRGQVDLIDNLEIGITNLLQFGGTGANHLGFGDWIAEHFTRKTDASNQDFSNRRVSIDASYSIRRLRGLRLYYEVAFEDWRKQFLDAFVYDADHMAGLDAQALDREGRMGLVVEYQHTGMRSQTHHLWTTGLTNAGRTVGTPLGPDSWSLFASFRVDTGKTRWWPWVEFVRRSSDTYSLMAYAPIYRTAFGVEETRYRAGLRVTTNPLACMRLDSQAFAERVENFGNVMNATQTNLGFEINLTWTPVF